MSPGFRIFLIVLVILMILPIGIYIETGIWAECRTNHSVMYCLRLLSR